MKEGLIDNLKTIARRWLVESFTAAQIGKELGLSSSSVHRRIKKMGLAGEKGNAALYAEIYRDRSTGDDGVEGRLRPVRLDIPARPTSDPPDSADHVQVVWSDVHYPFEDPKAVEILYQITGVLKPDILSCLGDLADFWQLSQHRPPIENKLKADQVNLQDTIDKAVQHLGQMEQLAQPDAMKTIEMGNHEDRWERLLADIQINPKTRQLLSMPKIAEVLNLDYLMGLSERGWKSRPYLGSSNNILFDRLLLTHGHKANKYAANSLLQLYGTNVVFGHSHRVQTFCENTLAGPRAGFNIGCLCDINPHWVPATNWTQGFAVITWKKTSAGWIFGLEQVIIHEGKTVFRGETYSG